MSLKITSMWSVVKFGNWGGLYLLYLSTLRQNSLRSSFVSEHCSSESISLGMNKSRNITSNICLGFIVWFNTFDSLTPSSNNAQSLNGPCALSYTMEFPWWQLASWIFKKVLKRNMSTSTSIQSIDSLIRGHCINLVWLPLSFVCYMPLWIASLGHKIIKINYKMSYEKKVHQELMKKNIVHINCSGELRRRKKMWRYVNWPWILTKFHTFPENHVKPLLEVQSHTRTRFNPNLLKPRQKFIHNIMFSIRN